MHLREADGSIGVVSRWKVVAGAKDMYNLEVEKDHTFTVGQGQYIVHNCGIDPEVIAEKWHPGNYGSEAESLADHFARHGEEVGAESVEQYFRKAEGFNNDLRRGRGPRGPYPSEGYTPGAQKWIKSDKSMMVPENWTNT